MKTRSQLEHEQKYPGTRQICIECDDPTG
ncbi:hypothetical protein LCGC14_3104530, partial [marine sediment metagenome]